LVNHTKPKVALFGGSFDPPHKGHQAIITKALEQLSIDRLLVVPAYLNPFKKVSLASASTRLAWCQRVFAPLPNVQVEAYEIAEGKPTFTSHTVKHFNQSYEVKYLIIGADNLCTLSKWHAFRWLNENVTWVIATRGKEALKLDELKTYSLLNIDVPISSTHIRQTKALDAIDTEIKTSVKDILEGKNL